MFPCHVLLGSHFALGVNSNSIFFQSKLFHHNCQTVCDIDCISENLNTSDLCTACCHVFVRLISWLFMCLKNFPLTEFTS